MCWKKPMQYSFHMSKNLWFFCDFCYFLEIPWFLSSAAKFPDNFRFPGELATLLKMSEKESECNKNFKSPNFFPIYTQGVKKKKKERSLTPLKKSLCTLLKTNILDIHNLTISYNCKAGMHNLFKIRGQKKDNVKGQSSVWILKYVIKVKTLFFIVIHMN